MNKIKIIKQQLLSDKTFPLKYISYEKPDLEGSMHGQENEVYFRPDAVAVLLADPGKEVFLLTRQFRMPTYLNGNETGYLVETCAGLIDSGETPEQSAKREAKEETGYAVTALKKIGAVYTSAGGITELLHLFIAYYDSLGLHQKGGGLEAEGEDIELVQMSFAEAKEWLCQGQINDAKTLILLQHYFSSTNAR
ncbi:MAG: NUDIX domain-containing protein [Bacteroidota bacterium]